MDLLVSLVVASIINTGIAGGDRAHVRLCFIVLIAFGLSGMAFSFAAQWFSAKASVGFAGNLRQALFDRMQSFGYAELDRVGTDTLITRLTGDIGQVQTGLNLALRLLLRSPFIVLGAVIMAFTVDAKSALVFAGALPLLSLVVFGIMNKSLPLYTKSRKNLDGLLGKTRENLNGARVVRAFCKEDDEIRDFDRANRDVTRVNLLVGKLTALMNPGTYLLINLATILLIRVGALRVNGGAIAQGDLVALYNYMAQIVTELIKLASLIISINKALACAKRVEAALDIQNTLSYGAGADKPDTDVAVSFKDVSFSYNEGGDSAIEHISFDALKGETIGVIGGTGSGKSTLVQLIPRFYDATAGTVEVNGVNVKQYAEGELIKLVGVVPQRAQLFYGSVRDNLKWGDGNADDESLWRALSTAQALETVEAKPGKLDFIIEQGGRNLSGGQRQRLTIARALVKQPRILILDDSASALDFATDLKLRRAINAMKGGATVFIVSQRASSVRSADRILVLDDGRLVGNGTHDELMRGCHVYREIYYSQFPDEKPGAADGKEALKAV